MRIQDRAIRQFTEKLSRLGSNELNDENVLELLAAAGDTFFTGRSRLHAALSRPDITKRDQFESCERGLSSREKADLATILDESGYQMTRGAREFLEALTGRVPLSRTFFGPLTLRGDQKYGIRGVARPGEKIEALNASTAPLETSHPDDATVIATADSQGRFHGRVPDMREGDLIRLRARGRDGATSDWLTLSARGIEPADVRDAAVNLDRIALVALGNGAVSASANTEQPVTEPDATLRFTNLRTSQTVDVRATENGSLPAACILPGKLGDAFAIATSDGRNNTTFTQSAGSLRVHDVADGPVIVDLPDPAPLQNDQNPDGSAKYEKVRFFGPLVVDEIDSRDVRQGTLANCYFPSALAAIAQFDPDILRKMVRENPDGTYTVTFYERGYGAPTMPVEVTVDGDLYARPSGIPLYGSSLGTRPLPDEMELWFPIIEKAYAQWKGSYETIGNGGFSGHVLTEVTGAPYRYDRVSEGNKHRIFEQIVACTDNGWPMTAATYGEDESARYTNTGVYAWHAYSVLGGEEEHGMKYVTLRNPWGQKEPLGNGPDDGIFRLELNEFVRLFQDLAYVPV